MTMTMMMNNHRQERGLVLSLCLLLLAGGQLRSASSLAAFAPSTTRGAPRRKQQALNHHPLQPQGRPRLLLHGEDSASHPDPITVLLATTSSSTASETKAKKAKEKAKKENENNNENEESVSSALDRVDAEKLPPVLRGIVCERREYQMNLGRAMDVLRTDMETILVEEPDFSIYHPDVRLTDPSGVQLRGLDKYQSAFAFFQTFLGFWFSPQQSSIQFRMVYDEGRSSIRISWNAVLYPRLQMPLWLRPVHVDGISYYRMDAPSGKIIEHKIERLIVNSAGVEPPYGILSLLQTQQDAGGGGVVAGTAAAMLLRQQY